MDSIHFEDIPFEQIVNQASVPDFPMDRQGTYTRGELSSFPAYMHVELVNGYLITPPSSLIYTSASSLNCYTNGRNI